MGLWRERPALSCDPVLGRFQAHSNVCQGREGLRELLLCAAVTDAWGRVTYRELTVEDGGMARRTSPGLHSQNHLKWARRYTPVIPALSEVETRRPDV